MSVKKPYNNDDDISFSLQVRCNFLDLLMWVKTLKDIHFIEVRHHHYSSNNSNIKRKCEQTRDLSQFVHDTILIVCYSLLYDVRFIF